MKKNIPYGRQSIDKRDISSVTKILRSPFLTQGPSVLKFENEFSQKVQADYCVAFNSGTAALHAAYFVAGIKQKDEFVTSPITFAATANAGLYLGARPIFSDVLANANIDPQLISGKITKKTKMIVPVHYGGLPCDLQKIHKIAREYHLIVIEDACHALGATYKNTKIGDCSYSDMTVFSFHPVKHITTGEGGAVTTNDKKYYDLLKIFRTHGITKENLLNQSNTDGEWYYEMQYLGYNYRLTDFQAALGSSQLKILSSMFLPGTAEILVMILNSCCLVS